MRIGNLWGLFVLLPSSLPGRIWWNIHISSSWKFNCGYLASGDGMKQKMGTTLDSHLTSGELMSTSTVRTGLNYLGPLKNDMLSQSIGIAALRGQPSFSRNRRLWKPQLCTLILSAQSLPKCQNFKNKLTDSHILRRKINTQTHKTIQTLCPKNSCYNCGGF